MKKLFIVLLILIFIPKLGVSATMYWIATSPGNWNNSANWSGGAVGSTPGVGDDVVFDAAHSNFDCTINVAIDVNSILLDASYTGTVSSAALSATHTIEHTLSTVSYAMKISGGTFTSTPGTLRIRGNFIHDGGIFNHSNGSVRFQILLAANAPLAINSPTATTFNNVQFDGNSFGSFTVNNLITIAATLILLNNGGVALTLDLNTSGTAILCKDINWGSGATPSGAILVRDPIKGYSSDMSGNASIDITGNLTVNGNKVTGGNGGGSGLIKFIGLGDQSIINPSSINNTLMSRLPSIMITKASGTMYFSGDFALTGPEWIYSSGAIGSFTSSVYFIQDNSLDPSVVPLKMKGAVSMPTTSFTFQQASGSSINILDNIEFNNVTVNSNNHTDFNVSSQIIVNDYSTSNNARDVRINTGTVYCKGNISISNTKAIAKGTGTFEINGSGPQLFTGTASVNQGMLPRVRINKPSNTLTLSNFISFCGDWDYVQGGVAPGTSTVALSDISTTQNITTVNGGNFMEFYNLLVPQKVDAHLQTDLRVLGDLTIQSSISTDGKLTTSGSGFSINIGGNFTCTGRLNPTSPYLVTFYGSSGGNQDISISQSSAEGYSNLPLYSMRALTTNNTTITLIKSVQISNSLTMTSGVVKTTATEILTLNNGASTNLGTQGPPVSFVDGPMEVVKASIGTSTLIFPVGSASDWRPVVLTFSHTTASSTTYTAQAFSGSASAIATLPATLQWVSLIRYWKVSTSSNMTILSATPAPTVEFFYGTKMVDDDAPNSVDLRLAGTDGPTGTTWLDLGGTGSANGTGSITSTASLLSTITSLGYFTLANSASNANSNKLGNTVLAIKLLDFGAEMDNETNRVHIHWKTVSEEDNDYFLVEKSTDGKTFYPISKVYGSGTTTQNHLYEIYDESPVMGTNYYRLKSVDFFGVVESFKSAAVENDAKRSLSVFPNPALVGEMIYAKINFEIDGLAELLIYNELGILVKRIQVTESVIPIPQLHAGIYFAKFSGRQYSIVVKVLVTK